MRRKRARKDEEGEYERNHEEGESQEEAEDREDAQNKKDGQAGGQEEGDEDHDKDEERGAGEGRSPPTPHPKKPQNPFLTIKLSICLLSLRFSIVIVCMLSINQFSVEMQEDPPLCWCSHY